MSDFTLYQQTLIMPPGLEGKYKTSDMELPGNYISRHPFDHGNFNGRDEALLDWPRTEFAIKDLLRVYYSVIDDMDAQIGRIVAALEETGQLKNTIIIFSSDNGMAVGSHGLRGKQNQYEHTTNVPLIISGPGIEEGVLTSAQVYLRELYPTTCDLIGIDIPEGLDGRSFAPVLRGEAVTHHNIIFNYYENSQRMVRTDEGWKLIRYPDIDKWQLFNLNNDPYELSNLVKSNTPEIQEKFNELQKYLVEWRFHQGDPLLVEE